MVQALPFVSEPRTGNRISSFSNSRFGGDISGGLVPCNFLNNTSLLGSGNELLKIEWIVTVSHWQASSAQPEEWLFSTKALSQPRLNQPQIIQTPKEPMTRQPSWGASRLQSSRLPSSHNLWGLEDKLHLLKLNIYLSILDCRRWGATGELYTVRCPDQICIFKRPLLATGGTKTRSWNVARGHPMDQGRKW